MRLLRVFVLALNVRRLKNGTIVAEEDIYSLIHVSYCLPQDASEEKVEQNWSKDTALFDSVGDGERV